MIKARLTLVSASPRRKTLLENLGIPFDVMPSVAAEVWHGRDAVEIVQANALRKVKRSAGYGDRFRLLLGADTIIWLQNHVLGKPIGRESALRMLTLLQERKHLVYTGICMAGVAPDGAEILTTVAHAVATVEFSHLSGRDLNRYLDSRDWEDKAGAYGIQGEASRFARCVEGDIDTVIGLSTKTVHELIRNEFGHLDLR